MFMNHHNLNNCKGNQICQDKCHDIRQECQVLNEFLPARE